MSSTITNSSPKDEIIDNALECIDGLQSEVSEYQQRNQILWFIIASFVTVHFIF